LKPLLAQAWAKVERKAGCYMPPEVRAFVERKHLPDFRHELGQVVGLIGRGEEREAQRLLREVASDFEKLAQNKVEILGRAAAGLPVRRGRAKPRQPKACGRYLQSVKARADFLGFMFAEDVLDLMCVMRGRLVLTERGQKLWARLAHAWKRKRGEARSEEALERYWRLCKRDAEARQMFLGNAWAQLKAFGWNWRRASKGRFEARLGLSPLAKLLDLIGQGPRPEEARELLFRVLEESAPPGQPAAQAPSLAARRRRRKR
jgi:hypothetical protein